MLSTNIYENVDWYAFITFRGPLLYRGKNVLNSQAKGHVYVTTWQMYMPKNVECRMRKKSLVYF